MNICVFGDSIAWGEYDAEKGGWVNRLKLFFENNKYNVDVYNLSANGGGTGDILARFQAESLFRKANVIIFAIGINDSPYIKTKDNPRVLFKKFKNNIKSLIEQSKKIAKEIIFIGFTAIDESKTMPIPWIRKFIIMIRIWKFIIRRSGRYAMKVKQCF